MKTNWLRHVRNFLVIHCLTLLTGAALAEEEVRVRVSLATDVVHGQGYWSPMLRIGVDGGPGLRVGSMQAPTWSRSIPAEVVEKNPNFKLDSVSFFEVDYEVCGQRWCGALGAARLDGLTFMNGTPWNFGLHVRYAITQHWSLVLDHYSHGTMLGIAQDKSNRGWNLLGVAYTF